MPGFFTSIALGWPYLLGVLLVGYLLGSIPFGLILTQLAGLGDIRRIGSGNIGATNVLRTGNKALAAATLLLDAAKGAAAVLVARHLFFYGPDAEIIAGAGAFLGPLFPVWLKFRGGKGVATTIGILLAIAWPVGLIVCAVWLLVALLSRYSSLAALIGIAAAPVAAWFLPNVNHQTTGLALFLAVVIWQRHHENIGRLLKGKESRISLGGSKKNAAG